MKRLSVLLTFALVLALAVPAFAADDNVKITGNVKTIFEAASYGDDVDAATTLWADDDVLDLDNPADGVFGDQDDFPAEKAFYQEIGLNVAGAVNENISFDLAVDTLVNNFTQIEGPAYDGSTLGDEGETSDLVMDTALLTITDGTSAIKAGDMDGFHAEDYFVDDEDLEGVEVAAPVYGMDLRTFVVSETTVDNDSDFEEKDFYGVTATKEMGETTLTGKLYQAREGGYAVTNLAVEADLAVNGVALNGEIVSNDADKELGLGEGDTLARINASYGVTDAVTVRGGFETVGEDFVAPANDLEEDAYYDKFTVGADYVLNANNTVKADYTMVDHADKAEKKNTIELGLENTMGAFTNTAAVEFTTNDNYVEDTDVTVLTLGTKYAMTDVTTVNAKLVNQSTDKTYDNAFTYLEAGVDHKLSDNVNWNTDVKLIDGEAKDTGDEGEGTSFTTTLDVSF